MTFKTWASPLNIYMFSSKGKMHETLVSLAIREAWSSTQMESGLICFSLAVPHVSSFPRIGTFKMQPKWSKISSSSRKALISTQTPWRRNCEGGYVIVIGGKGSGYSKDTTLKELLPFLDLKIKLVIISWVTLCDMLRNRACMNTFVLVP